MKANVPEKIYIHVRANKELGTTWHGKKITNGDIEYVRTDAFIEKACSWLDEKCRKFILTAKDIEDFKNYMEGE